MYVQKLLWAIMAIITAIPTILYGMVAFPTMIYLQAINEHVETSELWALYGITSDVLIMYTIIAAFTGALAYTIIIIVTGGILYELYQNKRSEREFLDGLDAQEVVGTEPGLLKTWWNAAHDKVCPMIEFVRNDD